MKLTQLHSNKGLGQCKARKTQVWQVEEHLRVREYARANLRNRTKDIANTLGSFIRGLQFRGGVVFRDRLQPPHRTPGV